MSVPSIRTIFTTRAYLRTPAPRLWWVVLILNFFTSNLWTIYNKMAISKFLSNTFGETNSEVDTTSQGRKEGVASYALGANMALIEGMLVLTLQRASLIGNYKF